VIACTNVANLLMARTADRAGELSIRSALGASRVRLARQLPSESLLLSFVATLAGLLVAYWTTLLAATVEPPPLGAQTYSILDGRVLGFTLVVSLLTAVFFGVLPSVYAGGIHAFGARGCTRTRGSRLVRESLVGAQVMLTMISSGGIGFGGTRDRALDENRPWLWCERIRDRKRLVGRHDASAG
jgi:hypothetical protein